MEDYIEEQAAAEFEITSAGQADWAVGKILEERQRRDIFISAAEEKIERLKLQIDEAKRKCEFETSFLLCKLDAYMDTVPYKKLKASCRLELPSGKLVRTLPKIEYCRNDEALIEFLKRHHPEYVKTTESPDWSKFKKSLSVQGESVIIAGTGEVVDCITAQEKPATFDVI